MAYEGMRFGRTSVADGGTITHGLGRTPSSVQLTGSVATNLIAATAISSTTITVGIKTAGGLAGTTQVVNWLVMA